MRSLSLVNEDIIVYKYDRIASPVWFFLRAAFTEFALVRVIQVLSNTLYLLLFARVYVECICACAYVCTFVWRYVHVSMS